MTNMVLDPNDVTKIIGVLDWEMCHDRRIAVDLGTALATGSMRGIERPATSRWSPFELSRQSDSRAVVERYALATGRDVSSMAFYLAFARFQGGRHPAANLLSLSPGAHQGSALRFVAVKVETLLGRP